MWLQRQSTPQGWSDEAERRERALWEAGPSAFWLDPDRWYGVRDPHRDMLWHHLHERPGRPPPAQIVDHEPHCSHRGDRVFRLLARANEEEYLGRCDEALELRAAAVEQARAYRS